MHGRLWLLGVMVLLAELNIKMILALQAVDATFFAGGWNGWQGVVVPALHTLEVVAVLCHGIRVVAFLAQDADGILWDGVMLSAFDTLEAVHAFGYRVLVTAFDTVYGICVVSWGWRGSARRRNLGNMMMLAALVAVKAVCATRDRIVLSALYAMHRTCIAHDGVMLVAFRAILAG